MLSTEEALKLVIDHTELLPPVTLPLDAADGLVLAEDIQARGNVPPFANSAMDGFAVRAADVRTASQSSPVHLLILEDVPAGHVARQPVIPGTAVRIMTGAPMPEGADSVIQVEDVRMEGEHVIVMQPCDPGLNVRQAGEDMRDGAVILPAGTVLAPGMIGTCAAAGHAQVRVYPHVRVAILTTGSELVDIADPLTPGHIRDANIHSLRAQVAAIGAAPRTYPRVEDTRTAVRTALSEALAAADVVLTNGGVSVGTYDFVKEVLEEMGAELVFWRVKQKPGKPLAFWTMGSKRIIGLPGNPVSCMVCTEEYVRPLLRGMMGYRRLFRPVRTGILEESYDKGKDTGRAHFLRVQVHEEGTTLHVRTTGPQGSGILTSMALAEAIAIIPEEVVSLPTGATVQVQLTGLPEDH